MHDATGRQSKATMDSGCGLVTSFLGFCKYLPREFHRKIPNSTCITGTEYTLASMSKPGNPQGRRPKRAASILPRHCNVVVACW
jgi:hypothetical protein